MYQIKEEVKQGFFSLSKLWNNIWEKQKSVVKKSGPLWLKSVGVWEMGTGNK